MMAHCQSDELMIPPIINYVLQSFSMPLFMMASGFLFNPNDTWSKFFKKKSARLLAPYLIVSLISYALKSVKDYLMGGVITIGTGVIDIMTGNTNYWFLYALFVIMCTCRVLHKNCLLVAFAFASFVLSYFRTDSTHLMVGRMVYFPFFFIFGYFLKLWYDRFISFFSQYGGKILLFMICLYGLSSCFINITGMLHVMNLSGAMVVWVGSIILVETSVVPINSFFTHFGKYSLQYYLNHLLVSLKPLIIFKITSPLYGVLSLIVLSCVRTVISWLMLKLQIKFRITRLAVGIVHK